MTDKNKKWSVNSGKWAYSQGPSVAPGETSGRNKAALIASILVLAGAGLVGSFWFGMLPLPFTAREQSQAQAPAPPVDGAGLEQEISRLKDQLAQTQRDIDEKQQVIDRQAQELQSAETSVSPPEYSVIKTTRMTRGSGELVIYADHQFVAGQNNWVRATCHFSPVVDGVSYWIELARRDQLAEPPKTRLASPETLSRASFSWPDIFSIASNCPWMDGVRYTPEELSSLALTEKSDISTPVSPLPAPDQVEMESVVREPRQVLPARDSVGFDISKVSDISQTECEALCINDQSCRGYTYDNWNRLCITKSEVRGVRIEPRSTTVVFSESSPRLSTVTPTMIKRNGRAFRDTAYNYAFASSYDACANLCLGDERCLAVNFRQDLNQCQFFAAPTEFGPSVGVILGYKSQLYN